MATCGRSWNPSSLAIASTVGNISQHQIVLLPPKPIELSRSLRVAGGKVNGLDRRALGGAPEPAPPHADGEALRSDFVHVGGRRLEALIGGPESKRRSLTQGHAGNQ
jgi:hypothetical protein